ncbi:MAG: hypothetical protein AMXMBFR7_36850 [Planctomycetota bacterium]
MNKQVLRLVKATLGIGAKSHFQLLNYLRRELPAEAREDLRDRLREVLEHLEREGSIVWNHPLPKHYSLAISSPHPTCTPNDAPQPEAVPAPQGVGFATHQKFLEQVQKTSGDWFKAGDLKARDRTTRTKWLRLMVQANVLESNGKSGSGREYRLRKNV